MSDKTCFVVMPIRAPGTDEYEYFRALRDTVVEPALDKLGYSVIRADDVRKGGAIARDIVTRLATSDLVVADLTDLNANVFYELGVRHALRGRGTIMIVDATRTEVPFDLRPYRVIEFTPDLRGIEKLRTMLVQFARAITGEVPDTSKDNPVHDFLPSLPADIYAYSAGSAEGELREELAKLREQVRKYAPDQTTSQLAATGFKEIVALALAQARHGRLPVDLVQRASLLARQENRVEFLEVLQQLSELPRASISAQDYLDLSRDAERLDLPDEIRLSLTQCAIDLRPNDKRFQRARLEAMAHSEDPAIRELARAQLLEFLKISLDGEDVVVPEDVEAGAIITFCVMLDAFHRDGLHDEGLAITTALLKRYPYSTEVLRNHGRALREKGRIIEAEEYFREAILAANVDPTSAEWYGNFLSRAEKHVDALEAYLLACRLGPDDPEGFIQVSDELANLTVERDRGQELHPRVPRQEVIDELLPRFVAAAFSCPTVDSDSYAFALRVVQKAEISSDMIDVLVAARRGTGNDEVNVKLPGRRERVELASSLYEIVGSEVTRGRSILDVRTLEASVPSPRGLDGAKEREETS